MTTARLNPWSDAPPPVDTLSRKPNLWVHVRLDADRERLCQLAADLFRAHPGVSRDLFIRQMLERLAEQRDTARGGDKEAGERLERLAQLVASHIDSLQDFHGRLRDIFNLREQLATIGRLLGPMAPITTTAEEGEAR